MMEVGVVDQNQIERIRNPQFPLARRGYEQREVDHFMLGLAEWLENGGVDEAGSYAVTRRLERAGETTARVLASAQNEAEQIIKEAEGEARQTISDANEASRKKLEQTRAEARAMVEEAERRRDGIRETIAQLTEMQRRAVAEISQLRDALAAAVPAPSATPKPAELPAGARAEGHPALGPS
jgi:cell division septum initiation protein DivIVA